MHDRFRGPSRVLEARVRPEARTSRNDDVRPLLHSAPRFGRS